MAGYGYRLSRPLGIHQGVRRGQKVPLVPVRVRLRLNVVVVRDHHRHPQLPGQPNLLDGRNAVVTGQDRVDPVPGRRPDDGLVDPVAVPDPIRYLVVRLSPQPAQPPVQDVGGADAVDVIVPHNAYPLTVPDLFLQNLNRPVHVGQKPRIIHLVHRTV